MTLTHFVAKNAFRNKRRSLLTLASIGVSLLLLTLLMTIWRIFYLDNGSASSALRLVTRHKVSITNPLPLFYEAKIRSIPGLDAIARWNWFGGKYIDDRPEHFFAQFGTDPDEIFKVFAGDWQIPDDQLKAWQRDRAGCVVSQGLVDKLKFKIGDRIHVQGIIYPVNLDLTVRGIYTATKDFPSLLFNVQYVDEAFPPAKGIVGTFYMRVDKPQDTTRVAHAIDDMFRNAPQPTKTETESAFRLGWIAMMGNVKLFILSICMAVVFAILLVSANTMAMSIRERVREVAVLKTLGFTRPIILTLFVGEAITLSLVGGVLGSLLAAGFLRVLAKSPAGLWLTGASVTPGTYLVALAVAALVGFISSFLPSMRASQLNIVEGLRFVG